MSQPQQSSSAKFLVTATLVIILGVIGYYILNAPDRRNTGEKISDAINELPKGVDKAARQLENRTPADKLNDAVKDTSNSVKKTTNQQ